MKRLDKGPSWKTHLAFLIQQVQDSHLGLDEVDAGLIVIEVDQSPGNLLLHVFLLLQFEHMLCTHGLEGNPDYEYVSVLNCDMQ